MRQYKVVVAAVIAALMTSQIWAQGPFSVRGANAYASNKDWNGLVQYAKNWTASDPHSEIAWYYLGIAYGTNGLKNPADAARAFEKAVALKQQWPEAWNALGFEYLNLKRYENAASAFQHAIDQAPAKCNYWHNLAFAYAQSNKLTQAISTLEQERQKAGASATYADWSNMGNDFAALGRLADAVSAYQKALQMNPHYGDAWNNLGVTEQELGNFKAALDHYRRAASLGDSLGQDNASKLESGLASAQQQGGGREVTPQMVREFVRQGQAKAFEINHPGSIAQPYGHP